MKHGSEWYKREPSAFLGGVQGMTSKEHAVYSVTLDLIYQHGGSVNNDPSWIAGWIRDMGASAVRNTIAALVSRNKLVIEGDQITEKRAKTEAKTKENLRETARENGKKGGEKSSENRVNRKKNKDLGEPIGEVEKPAEKTRQDKSKEESKDSLSGFDVFWGLWPDKTGKEAARKAWRKLHIEDRRLAFSAVRDGWFQRWQHSKPDANPIHASSFLNSKRWTDEFTPPLKAIDGGRYDRPNPIQATANRPENRPDAALEQIARLAGLSQTQGAGGCGT